jgi:hypothetical protein
VRTRDPLAPQRDLEFGSNTNGTRMRIMPRPPRSQRTRALNWAYLDVSMVLLACSAVAVFTGSQDRAECFFLVVATLLVALRVWAMFADRPPEDQ